MSGLGATDWRPALRSGSPDVPRRFDEYRGDLSSRIAALETPTLLLRGDSDPISMIGVDARLASLLRNASLCVLSGGGHDVARTHSDKIAPLVDEHLKES